MYGNTTIHKYGWMSKEMTEGTLKKFKEYDYYATPLFDGLQLAFSKENLEKSGNVVIFPFILR